MRVFLLFLSIVPLAACAQVAGLPSYETTGDDGFSSSGSASSGGDDGMVEDDATVDEPEASSGSSGSSDGSGSGASSGSLPSSGGDTSQSGGEDATSGDDQGAGDAGADAGEGPSDAALVPDTYVCRADTCNGCCTSDGYCAGGQSVDTCGVGGHACQDCTSAGACSSGGQCTSPPKDAGAPMACNPANCHTCAIAPIQGACCKLDNTCGCQFSIFDPCM